MIFSEHYESMLNMDLVAASTEYAKELPPRLFSNAETPKNFAKQVIGRELAGDPA